MFLLLKLEPPHRCIVSKKQPHHLMQLPAKVRNIGLTSTRSVPRLALAKNKGFQEAMRSAGAKDKDTGVARNEKYKG